MAQVHTIIDGSWLFKLCDSGKIFSKRVLHPKDNSVGDRPFSLNFKRLNDCILKFLEVETGQSHSIGKLYISTSIFDISKCNPPFEDWPNIHNDVTNDQITRMKNGIFARQKFVENATKAQYNTDLHEAVYEPELKIYKFRAWRKDEYREKQVDSTVVALLIKLAAVETTADYTVVITGDLDMLPAIKVTVPDFTSKVVLVTVHPDNLDEEDQVSSFELIDFVTETGLKVLYLDDVVDEIVHIPSGLTEAYKCDALGCGLAFTSSHIKEGRQHYCPKHKPQKK